MLGFLLKLHMIAGLSWAWGLLPIGQEARPTHGGDAVGHEREQARLTLHGMIC